MVGLDRRFMQLRGILLLVSREKLKLCSWAPGGLNKERSMNSCDWTDCSLEVGLFDGAPRTLLSAEGRKNIPVERNSFINLCPDHFELGVASLKPMKIQWTSATVWPLMILIFLAVIYLGFPN
jgi:hypothetical protein